MYCFLFNNCVSSLFFSSLFLFPFFLLFYSFVSLCYFFVIFLSLHTQDLLQSLTQVETNANLVVHGSGDGDGGSGERGTTERKHQKTKQQSSVSVLCTAMTLYPRHVGVFRAVSGIIINCCTSRGNSSSHGFSSSFTEEGYVFLFFFLFFFFLLSPASSDHSKLLSLSLSLAWLS